MSRGMQSLAMLLLWVAILLPSLGMPYPVERVFLVALALVCMMSLLVQGSMPRQYFGGSVAPIFVLLGFLSLQYAAVYAYGLATGQASGLRDLAEMPRYLFWMAFLAFLITARVHIPAERVVRRVLVPSIYGIALLLLLYASPVPILSESVRLLYAGTKTALNLSSGFLRWAIPFENPNFLGLYLVWVLCAILFSPRVRGMTLMLTLGLIFLTGSRAAWAGTVLVAIIWLLWSLRARRLRDLLRVSALAAGSVAAIAATGRVDLSSMVRVQLIPQAIQAGGLLQEPNIAFRIEQSRVLAQQALLTRPLFGFGPGKYQVADIIDNQYVLWLARNGAVGLLLIACVLVILLWRPLRQSLGRAMGRATAGLIAFSASSAAILLTGSFLDNLRLLFVGLSILLLVMGNRAEESDSIGP